MVSTINQNQGTIITWRDSGGTHVITLKGLASGTGRQGAEHDFGVAAVAPRYMWQAFVQMDTATPPVLKETIDIFWKTSPNGNEYDNDDGTGDIAVSAEDKLNNLLYLGSISIDEAAADVHMQISGGPLPFGAEKGMPVFWNATADTLDDDAAPTNTGFDLIPVPLEI